MSELIVSLDISEWKQLNDIVEKLGENVNYYKIGAIPFTAFGIDVVRMLQQRGKKIFLDLKFFDIPNTVGKAVEIACDMGISLLTVHISGGKRMLGSAVNARNKKGCETKIIGVTVLTSFSQDDLAETGINEDINSQITRLADIGYQSGIDGIVCSVPDLKFLRNKFPEKFLMICPGIRPFDTKDDQKRVATVSLAVKSGADFIVVGRPIIESKNPVAVVEQIRREMKENEQ